MRETLTIAKALSDENRLRILMMLEQGEACVCQIVALLDLAPSTVSKHLSILKGADLIDSYKQGRWIYYHLVPTPSQTARGALLWVMDGLKDSKTIQQDRHRGRVICEQDPEVFARLQRQR